MKVLAIEIDQSRYDSLCEAMKPFTADPWIAQVRHSTLHDLIDRLMDYMSDKPVLFFLDPFGVEGIWKEDLPKALSGPSNEVFALFSDVGAKRLHATLLTEERNMDYEVQQVLEAPMLFDGFTEEDAARKKREVERSTFALRNTQEASERILSQALGADALSEIDAVPKEERPAKMTEIFMRLLRDAGARYVISFPVRDSRNSRVYQLAHASKSRQGLRSMKASMQAALRASALPNDVQEVVSLETAVNVQQAITELCKRFAGQEMRWTIGGDKGNEETIRKHLLEETPVFPQQCLEIREGLIAKGWQTSKRPYRFRFPD